MLIMAYGEKKTLRHVLDSSNLSVTERLNIVKGVSRGMYAIHNTNPTILHLDLKPSNVLLSQDMVPWITDFGLSFAMSASMSANSTTLSGRGTLRYKAPESWRPKSKGGPLTHKPTDVYSFAMLTWETFTGTVPFADIADTAVIDLHKDVYYGEFKEGDQETRPSLTLDSIPDTVKTILSACWDHDFEKRLNFQRVCQRLDGIKNGWSKPTVKPDDLIAAIKYPYIIAWGHSSYRGYGKDVKLENEQAFVSFTEPGEYGWSDEAKTVLDHIKKYRSLPGKIKTQKHYSKGKHYPAAEQH
jgi:serine/threonine protein kinase